MITGPRNQLVGGHVTREMKAALKKQAKSEKLSVSQLIYKELRRFLTAKGHKFTVDA